MEKTEQYFYKYTVVYYEEVDDKPELITTTGLTFGANFNDVCGKLTNYFGENTIEEMKIEFLSDSNVLEEDELAESFCISKDKQSDTRLFDEIKTGLEEAQEYVRGNTDCKTTLLSTSNETEQ